MNKDYNLEDKLSIIKTFNPTLNSINSKSPLSIGNGCFCFTADITGLQTLYEDYIDETPLCTMAEWAWHTKKADNAEGFYTLKDVKMTEYDFCGRKVSYPRVKFEGNETQYDWVRQNPHKFNLARIAFTYKGNVISSENINCINQTLDLSTGILNSNFKLKTDNDYESVNVISVCDTNADTIAFNISSPLLTKGLAIDFLFPYASCDITGSDWNNDNAHSDVLVNKENNIYCINRTLDDTNYFVNIRSNGNLQKYANHCYRLTPDNNTFEFCVNFTGTLKDYDFRQNVVNSFNDICNNSTHFWNDYWNSGKFFIHKNKELMRRVILSQYLLIINDSGYIPPAETGLTCNSWYGKAHLEMHYWHMAWTAMWGHPNILEKSFDWYINILPKAKENAERNGYRGARWTKMVSYTGEDCPSKIAPLLVWQQPHIINMLQLVRDSYLKQGKSCNYIREYMQKYWILINETATFIEDYLVYDINTDTFNIEAPVIPVQERHLPEDTRNPIFELAYFRYGLKIAAEWANELGHTTLSQKWNNIARRIAPLPVYDGLYISQENCKDTFTNKAIDHPLMLQVYGMLDNFGADEIIDKDIYKATLKKVMECWDYSTLWGWDFAVIAMAADKLGLKDIALNQLLIESPKNEYVESGNNRQNSRKDLPLYLPGNGSLLIAVSKIL